MAKHYRITTSVLMPPLPETVTDHTTETIEEALKEHMRATEAVDTSDGRRRTITWVEITRYGERPVG